MQVRVTSFLAPSFISFPSCSKEGQVYLKLRGLCSHTNIDQFWVPRNSRGELVLYGIIRLEIIKKKHLFFIHFASSEIKYDYEENMWRMTVDGKREKTTAISRNSLSSVLLGKSSWIVEKDNPGL